MSEKVTLTRLECFDAAMVGILRFIESLFAGHEDKGGAKDEDFCTRIGIDILGAMGELVIAKILNLHWSRSINGFKTTPDIEPNLEVKTPRKSHHRLMIRKGDDPSRIYVLVLPDPEPPFFKVVGSIRGFDAMLEEHVENPGNRGEAYFVPTEKLRPWSEGLAE